MYILKGSLLGVCLILIAMAKAETKQEALQAVTTGANKFSWSLFQAVAEEKPGNLIMSPLSASVALAMAAFGAGGETKQKFKQVLHLPAKEELGTAGYQALIDDLKSVQENKLLLANKVFPSENLNVKPTYKELTETYFRSTTQLLDFSQSAKAANTINSWVEQNTNNLIKDLVNPGDFNRDTAMVLVNAVYFKGQWEDKFDPEYTKELPFNVNENTVKNVSTMYRQGRYRYGELPNLNAKFIEIPYKGGDLSMLIILPNEINGLTEVEKKLKDVSIADILNQGSSREVQLFLPKFKIESKMDLGNSLIKIGLGDIFSSSAEFSGISDDKLRVSKVVQKAFIEVNEEGSEAAAATGIIMVGRGMAVEEPPSVIINRPFLYSIIKASGDRESGNRVAIFTGHVCDPSLKEH